MKSNLRGEIIKDSHVYLYAHATQHPRGLVYLKILGGILMYLRMTMPLQKFCILDSLRLPLVYSQESESDSYVRNYCILL